MRPSRRQTPLFTRPWAAGRPAVTAVLVALGVGAYVSQLLITLMLDEQNGAGMLMQWLALDRAGLLAGQWWKIFTYSFLHAHPLHLLCNALLLYPAGREVEPIIGGRHLLAIYGLGLLVGSLAHAFAMPAAPLVGASAGVVAVLIAFCTILPELEVTMMLFFLIPVRLRARHLALALLLVAATLWYTWTLPEIGPVAMLAACAAAWLYVKQLGFGNPLAIQRYIFDRRERAARLERMSPEQFISTEIDPILEKISRQGMSSLTRAERRLLAMGREKIVTKGKAR
jgi:membrane associated rhomboid family serine protease